MCPQRVDYAACEVFCFSTSVVKARGGQIKIAKLSAFSSVRTEGYCDTFMLACFFSVPFLYSECWQNTSNMHIRLSKFLPAKRDCNVACFYHERY